MVSWLGFSAWGQREKSWRKSGAKRSTGCQASNLLLTRALSLELSKRPSTHPPAVEFSGSSTLKLDAKGRVFLPKRFTEFEDEKNPGMRQTVTHFWLTLGLDGCLWLLDQNEWKRMQRRLKAMEIGDKKQRAVHRLFFGNAERLKPDSQGRITLPEKLRQKVGIEKEIELVGAGRRIEIWSSTIYQAQMAEAETNWMDDLEAVLGGGGFE